MQVNNYDLEVRVHGHAVREYPHEGKHYIEGKKGSDFTLRVNNRSSDRILAIVSVDGLSVMDGKDASFDSGGYVIEAFGHLDIPGWRLDMTKIAKFVFSGSAESYAASTGKPRNVGVIGCAVFREKPKPWSINGWLSFNNPFVGYGGVLRGMGLGSLNVGDTGGATYGLTSSTVCSATQSSSESATAGSCDCSFGDLGTAFGAQADHGVCSVTFDRLESPDAVIEVCYASREALVKRGVDLTQKPAVVMPNPFPGNQFCQPPAGWTGK